MFYYIDGYNFLFHQSESSQRSLATERQIAIHFLQKHFAKSRLSGEIVFDGAHRREEESGRGYQNPLEVVYAPKGQSADAYIVEKIEEMQNPGEATVVTNDRGLAQQARYAGAHIETNEKFLKKLQKKKPATEKKKRADTTYQIERLLKIFENRLEEED